MARTREGTSARAAALTVRGSAEQCPFFNTRTEADENLATTDLTASTQYVSYVVTNSAALNVTLITHDDVCNRSQPQFAASVAGNDVIDLSVRWDELLEE